jgi:hypothetical protein
MAAAFSSAEKMGGYAMKKGKGKSELPYYGSSPLTRLLTGMFRSL